MDGPNGILPFLRKRVKEKRYALVVLAEGAGEELVGISGELDKGGNKAKPMIAEYLQKEFVKYFESFGEEATLKYVDPSYMVRSVPANGAGKYSQKTSNCLAVRSYFNYRYLHYI